MAITGSVFLARLWLDKDNIKSLGLAIDRLALYDVMVGIAIAALQIACLYVIMRLGGWLVVEGFAWNDRSSRELVSGLTTGLVLYVFVGWQEELLSRGFHLQTLARESNLLQGTVVSSFIFAAMHLGNPNSQSKIMVMLGIFLAGIYLAYGYLRTKQLWLSIGLHIGWNFFQGPIFGFPVSGTDSFRLLRTVVQGPIWLTGGDFGPEAGLIVVPILGLGILLIHLFTKGRKIDPN